MTKIAKTAVTERSEQAVRKRPAGAVVQQQPAFKRPAANASEAQSKEEKVFVEQASPAATGARMNTYMCGFKMGSVLYHMRADADNTETSEEHHNPPKTYW